MHRTEGKKGVPIDLPGTVLVQEVVEAVGRARRLPWRPSRWSELGFWGEWITLRHLRRCGWDILARNWKGRRGELDLVAFDGPFLVFVEVKTRRMPSSLPPEEQVTRAKERQIEKQVDEFVLRHEMPGIPVRIDLVAVETEDMVGYRLRHHKGWNAYMPLST